jgi:hypothetical protein
MAGPIDQTIANVLAHQGLFVAVIFCYLINFIGDVVIAWALYFLLLPTNRAVSLTDSAGSSTGYNPTCSRANARGSRLSGERNSSLYGPGITGGSAATPNELLRSVCSRADKTRPNPLRATSPTTLSSSPPT